MNDPKATGGGRDGRPTESDTEQTMIRGQQDFYGTDGPPQQSESHSRADRVMGRLRGRKSAEGASGAQGEGGRTPEGAAGAGATPAGATGSRSGAPAQEDAARAQGGTPQGSGAPQRRPGQTQPPQPRPERAVNPEAAGRGEPAEPSGAAAQRATGQAAGGQGGTTETRGAAQPEATRSATGRSEGRAGERHSSGGRAAAGAAAGTAGAGAAGAGAAGAGAAGAETQRGADPADGRQHFRQPGQTGGADRGARAADEEATQRHATDPAAGEHGAAEQEATGEHGRDNRRTGRFAGAAGAVGAGAGSLAARLRGRRGEESTRATEADTPTHPGTGAAAEAVPAPARTETGDRTESVTRENPIAHEPRSDSGDTETRRRIGAARRTRKARLRLSMVDPWSVMKTALLFSVAGAVVLWVAVGIVWGLINTSGLFGDLNKMIGEIVQTPGDTTPFRIQDYVTTSKVMGTAALFAAIDVVLITALATLGAFLYNLASAMIGGLEVTLAED